MIKEIMIIIITVTIIEITITMLMIIIIVGVMEVAGGKTNKDKILTEVEGYNKIRITKEKEKNLKIEHDYRNRFFQKER